MSSDYYTYWRAEIIVSVSKVKKVINLGISLFVAALIFGNVGLVTAKADNNTISDFNTLELPIETEQHYIPWLFIVYDEPNFMARKIESFPPQYVDIYETNGEGWALIYTYKGSYWVYLNSNLYFTDKHTSIYSDIGDETPIGTLTPQVVKVIEQQGDWQKIETWLGEKWIIISSVRESVLLDVPIYNQRDLGYPTGCEIVSLAMMINYSEEVDVKTLVAEMPLSHDPNLGFRGSPASENGFTIFPQALLSVADEYLETSYDMSGCEMADLKEKLNKDHPIVVWVNGMGFNVHAICLTGYDENGFFYNDPWTGKKNSFITYKSFYTIWNKPFVDSVYNIKYPARKALSYKT